MYFSFLLSALPVVFLSNNYIKATEHLLHSGRHKDTDAALSIAHISDLHNKNFGFNQSYLIRKIRSLHPDIIVITGDLVDHAAYGHAVALIQKTSDICPIYYVRGNHEKMAGNFSDLEKELLKYHVHILKNKTALLTKDDITYSITGLDDPEFHGFRSKYLPYMKKTLDRLTSCSIPHADYRILLSHRPELFHLYSSYPFDLVLCGHAHGGQFRLPFTDGLYAPNQGIFPKYTSGVHTKNHTTEIISRGLGNSRFPLRLFNFPEIVHIVIR